MQAFRPRIKPNGSACTLSRIRRMRSRSSLCPGITNFGGIKRSLLDNCSIAAAFLSSCRSGSAALAFDGHGEQVAALAWPASALGFGHAGRARLSTRLP
jgi:hypothetical protein